MSKKIKLKEHQAIYVRSMGKALRVTALFTSDSEANQFMKKNPDHGVIAEYSGIIFVANIYDNGINIPK